MTVATVITDRVSEILVDEGAEVWTTAQLIAWVNDFQRTVCKFVPDAKTAIVAHSCAAGAAQALAAGTARRLIRVVRNTSGNAIRGPVSFDSKSEFDPSWIDAAESSTILEYCFDPEVSDTRFWVDPPAAAGTSIDVEVAQDPTDITALTDAIDLEDKYLPAGIDWLLWRAFSRDDEETPTYQKAERHRMAFLQHLGVSAEAEQAIDPRNVERP